MNLNKDIGSPRAKAFIKSKKSTTRKFAEIKPSLSSKGTGVTLAKVKINHLINKNVTEYILDIRVRLITLVCKIYGEECPRTH